MDPSPKKLCSSLQCDFNDLFISCQGKCGHRFHAVCVGLSAADVPVIASTKNLFWLCNDCSDQFRTNRAAFVLRFGRSPDNKEEPCCASSSCVFNDQFVSCAGICGKPFHAMCVKLSKSDLTVINSSENIVWICDACNGRVPSKLDEPEEEPAEVETVKDDSLVGQLDTKFEVIIEKLNRLSHSLQNNSPPDSSPSSQDPETGLDDEPSESEATKANPVFTFGITKQADSNVETSWSFLKPMACADLFKKTLTDQNAKPTETNTQESKSFFSFGVKLAKDENNNPPTSKPVAVPATELKPSIVPMVIKKDDSKFYLWIKFDEPHMTEHEAEKLIRKALGMSRAECIDAHDVIPRHLGYSEVESSSFKVTMDARWKALALKQSTWRLTEHYDQHSEWVNR